MGYFAKVRVASSNLVARSIENPLVTGGFSFSQRVEHMFSRRLSVHIRAIRADKNSMNRLTAPHAQRGP